MAKIIKTKAKVNKNTHKPVVTYLLSTIKGVVLSFVGLVVISVAFINNGSFTTFTKIMIYVVLGIGAFICGYISNKKLNGRGLVNGFISTAIYLLIYFTLLLIVMKFKVGLNILIMIPVCLVSGITGGILSANS